MKKHSKKPFYFFTLLLLVVAGYFIYSQSAPPASAPATTVLPAASSTAPAPTANYALTPGVPAPRPAPAGSLEYHSIVYHFSLLYPAELTAKEFKEQGTAQTTTFGDQSGERGFQIFIVPYPDTKITPERLKMDVPSGVVDQQTSVTVDGTPGTMFYSTNVAMGDTLEIWFIRKGFLYEVTTYKALDTWLEHIMQSWQFL